jgi:hypothetical protein
MKSSSSIVDIYPSATPSPDEVKAWQALDREEQVKRIRELLDEAEKSGFVEASMEEIIKEANDEMQKEIHAS